LIRSRVCPSQGKIKFNASSPQERDQWVKGVKAKMKEAYEAYRGQEVNFQEAS
jgi:hypothetical protein